MKGKEDWPKNCVEWEAIQGARWTDNWRIHEGVAEKRGGWKIGWVDFLCSG